MGKLVYADAELDITIEDRTLTHLQIVIGSKLRRHESFFFSWTDDPTVGNGRSSVWLDACIPLYFTYDNRRTPLVNREWLGILTTSANSGSGLVFSAEPNSATGTTAPPRSHI